MVIRKEQMRALEMAQTSVFCAELAAHVRRIAPVQCARMGDAAVRSTVALGVQRAAGHRFTLRGSVRFYVETMFMLGSHFDTDCQYAGITGALSEEDDAEIARADRLYESVMAFADAALGPDRCFEIEALDRASQIPFEKLTGLANRPETALVEALREIYPEKIQVLGDTPVTGLIRSAHEYVGEQGPGWANGASLAAEMMFLLGESCFSDPQYPWIGKALGGESGSEPGVERLHREFAAFASKAADPEKD